MYAFACAFFVFYVQRKIDQVEQFFCSHSPLYHCDNTAAASNWHFIPLVSIQQIKYHIISRFAFFVLVLSLSPYLSNESIYTILILKKMKMEIVSQDLWANEWNDSDNVFPVGQIRKRSIARSDGNKCPMNTLKMYDKCNLVMRDGNDNDDEIYRFSQCECICTMWNEMKWN